MNSSQSSTEVYPSKQNGAEATQDRLTLRSGTGAPIFEPGPHTRIRRNPVRAIASLTWDGGPREVFGQIRNVSLTGCLLRTESSIPRGTTLSMTISLIGAGSKEEFDVIAKVCRETTVEGRRGYGLEFVFESRNDKRTVQTLYSQTA